MERARGAARVSSILRLSVVLWFALALAPSGSQAQRFPSYVTPVRGESQAVVASTAATTEDSRRSWLFGADSGADDSSGTLFRIHAVSADAHAIGETGFISVTDVAFLPDGRFFGVTFTDLLRIDPQAGNGEVVGSGIGFGGVNALVSDSNGQLYAATTSGRFIGIDPETGRGTHIGFYGGGLVSSGDLAFALDGTLFGTATDGGFSDLLVRIDLSTGKATVVGSIGFSDVFGLAFGPDQVLYGSANGDEFSIPLLIRVHTTTGQGTAIQNIPDANGMFGLGANVRLSPVVGPLRVTGRENSNCVNIETGWTFCQHRTGFHRPLGGIQESDDTYAWDINLLGNEDREKPVFAIAPGRVVKYAGVVSPQGNDSGAVLVEHSLDGSSCDVTPTKCWWSGYLHMRDI